jgi:EpsI family protein
MVSNSKSFLFSFTALVVTFICIIMIAKRGEPIVVSTNLEKIPMEIGVYEGIEDKFPAPVYKELNADMHLYRHYRNPDGSVISIYIGYYGTAKGGRTGHNPYACLPSAGWGIVKNEKVALVNNGEIATVNALIAQKGDKYEVVLHWYQSNKNKVLDTGIKQNIQRLKSRILRNRNDGAFVRLSKLTQHDKIEPSKKQIKEFGEMMLLLFPKYWPEER